MHISHEDLVNYLSGFKSEQAENVYKAILDCDMLENAFSTTEGKLVLNQVVEIVTANVISIVSICVESNPEEASSKIYPKCLEIGLAHKTLVGWAKILSAGTDHKKKIIKKKETKNG